MVKCINALKSFWGDNGLQYVNTKMAFAQTGPLHQWSNYILVYGNWRAVLRPNETEEWYCCYLCVSVIEWLRRQHLYQEKVSGLQYFSLPSFYSFIFPVFPLSCFLFVFIVVAAMCTSAANSLCTFWAYVAKTLSPFRTLSLYVNMSILF